MRLITTIFLLWIFCHNHQVNAQNPEQQGRDTCKTRKIITIGSTAIGYTGGMASLYQLWYKDYPLSSFHFFNDNKEWLQMDKAGHFYSAYHLSETAYLTSRYSCFNEISSIWVGGSAGILFLTTVEIFDGFSDGWGASWGDFIANTSGYLMFASQQELWQEQRIRLKFSYFPSQYAQCRPDVLGDSFSSRIFKDYNAQTYWLSFSPASFFEGKNRWPEWLAISLGYSGDGMTGGFENPVIIDQNCIHDFKRQRQYYLSLDLNLDAVQTRSPFLNNVLHIVNLLKIPFPAIEIGSEDGFKAHYLYF